jgi:exodeoxyribonuclease VII large subunit
MSVFYLTQSQSILVSGKTYPYREILRGLGGQYQAQDKSWLLPLNDASLKQVQELCRTIGGGLQKADKPPAASLPKSAPTLQNDVLISDPASESPVGNLVDGLTVAELMQKLQLAIAQNFPRSLWVVGEIQNFRQTTTGSYFQLADFKEGASKSATMTVNAAIWRSQWQDMERKIGRDALKELLVDGLRVRVLVDVSLFKDRGQVSLQVQAIDPSFTKGTLALAREKLLRELRAKGLDQKNKTLPWPAFPLHIGLISAEDSRAKSDFLDQLLVYGFPGRVSFFPAQMQGENTLRDVVAGIQALQTLNCDLLVITRGGGSAADLRWFDSPEIAYAIAAASIPIVAAIGHHDDVCIAEEISARREKTPTAAADFCVHLIQQSQVRIEQLGLAMARSLAERLRLQTQILQNLREKLHLSLTRVTHQHSAHLAHVRNELQMRSERRLFQWTGDQQKLGAALYQKLQILLLEKANALQRYSQLLHNKAGASLYPWLFRIEELKRSLAPVCREALQQQREKLLLPEKKLLQSDPQPWMTQGWTQLFADGKKLDRAEQLTTGMQLRARLLDALLELKLEGLTRLSPKPSAVNKESPL